MVTETCWEETCKDNDVCDIEEVWFDYGFASNSHSKYISGKVVCDHNHPISLCRKHASDGAAQIAYQSLQIANTNGFYPQRWWVRFANGVIFGGFIFPPMSMN